MALLFLNEVAERLRCSYDTAGDLVRTGKLKRTRISGRIQVDERDLEEFINFRRGAEVGAIETQNLPKSPKLAQFKRRQKAENEDPYAWTQRVRKR